MPTEQIHILPYRGFANREQLFLKGRVLESERILPNLLNGLFYNFFKSFLRFETDEIPGASVEIRVGENVFEVVTDHEGYLTLDTSWEAPTIPSNLHWIEPEFELTHVKGLKVNSVSTRGEVLLPPLRSDFGIITDVDDTVLRTYVTSPLKLRMLYVTFLKNPKNRLAVEGTVKLFRALTGGSEERVENPVFYVSSSPWNLYRMLVEFLEFRGFPKGPILLMDYGLIPSGAYRNHKLESISKILSVYTDMPFILLGDTAAKDADHYLELARRFPNRIRVIYIRKTKNSRNARRVAKLLSAATHVEGVIVQSSAEIAEHARSIGLIK